MCNLPRAASYTNAWTHEFAKRIESAALVIPRQVRERRRVRVHIVRTGPLPLRRVGHRVWPAVYRGPPASHATMSTRAPAVRCVRTSHFAGRIANVHRLRPRAPARRTSEAVARPLGHAVGGCPRLAHPGTAERMSHGCAAATSVNMRTLVALYLYSYNIQLKTSLGAQEAADGAN